MSGISAADWQEFLETNGYDLTGHVICFKRIDGKPLAMWFDMNPERTSKALADDECTPIRLYKCTPDGLVEKGERYQPKKTLEEKVEAILADHLPGFGVNRYFPVIKAIVHLVRAEK